MNSKLGFSVANSSQIENGELRMENNCTHSGFSTKSNSFCENNSQFSILNSQLKNTLCILLSFVFFSCTQIDRINSGDPDGVAYNPGYYIQEPSSSSVPSSSSAGTSGVYCLIDAGDFGKFCSDELVYDNCESFIGQGYSVEAVSSCGGY